MVAQPQTKSELKPREGFLIVVLFWTVLAAWGNAVYLRRAATSVSDRRLLRILLGLNHHRCHHVGGLDSLPKAILFYRQMLQWLGGMGIIVLAVAILPILGVGGMQLYRAEMPGPLKDNKMRPRIAETAKPCG